MRLHCLFPVFPVSPGLWEEQIRRTEVQNLSNLQNLPNLQSHNTWIIHHFARLSLEIRNNNNYRRLPKFSLFPVFFAVSVSTFWALDFFRGFVGFFRRFVGFFRRFKTGKHMQHEKHAKSVRRQKKMPPAIIPEKAIILHTLEDASILSMCTWELNMLWMSLLASFYTAL